jgi:DNA mismatch repair protein MutL
VTTSTVVASPVRIVVMPASLASQIAAGEVVERPASAVKELVENAIDAGATRCDVEIEGGGITRLVVSDDGHGMSRADAALAVERHATSKLFTVEDLGRVTTFGFRGEALPSIASVSRFSLRTRTAGEDAGTLVSVDGIGAPAVSPIGAPIGTTVEVRDLFFNVAPRRKFLRSASTESGHVADVLEAAALARPDLTFTLSRDGRRVREWLRDDGREGRAQAVVGDGLAACRGERGPLRVEAYLSRPEHARAGAAGLRFLVNGRPVRDRALLHTVAQAYGSVLERGRYPKGVVYLDLSPALVDVNVHPQKAEVRFADHRATTDAVYYVLSRELAQAFSLPEPARSPWNKRDTGMPRPTAPVGSVGRGAGASPPDILGRPAEPDGAPSNAGVVPAVAPDAFAVDAADGSERSDAAQGPLAVGDSRAPAPFLPSPAVRWTSLRFIAQVRQTYLVCEGEEGLYIIDQHAAAERVNFDRMRKQYRSRAVPSQALLFPITLTVRPEDTELVEEKAQDFAALGLDLRVRGVDALSVHAVPKLLVRASPEQLVRDLIAEVSRSGHRAFSDTIDLALATMACHGSIRAGDAIAATEASALLAALDYADFAGHCPHGRPVVAFTSFRELERKVGRR